MMRMSEFMTENDYFLHGLVSILVSISVMQMHTLDHGRFNFNLGENN
jgi:hypothetical protein